MKSSKRTDSELEKATNVIHATVDKLKESARGEKHFDGVLTGFKDVDEITLGLSAGELVVIASRPSVGKTSLALNFASRAAQLGTSVAYFGLEMDSTKAIQRIMCSEARISSRKMRAKTMSAQERERMTKVSDSLSKLDIWFDDTPKIDVFGICDKARRKMKSVEPGMGLIIVDYLQLVQPSLPRSESRQAEIAEVTRELKALARETEVPVIVLSQLSRSIESRPGKRPLLSDLSWSGSIEQDADIVIFIDRSMSESEAEEEDRPPLGVADVIIAKNRNGVTGVAHLAFQPEFMRFDNLAYCWDAYGFHDTRHEKH